MEGTEDESFIDGSYRLYRRNGRDGVAYGNPAESLTVSQSIVEYGELMTNLSFGSNSRMRLIPLPDDHPCQTSPVSSADNTPSFGLNFMPICSCARIALLQFFRKMRL
ncbi:hypothetical protein [Rhodoferax sp.]|uniref:hypothetical protein n=1 Tax=Rhodoferax sp. TaxID=50421 RepID=UPI0025F932E8|nr:hypothetical protein [Rhodoferax sp.]MCM2340521.1 hypothetical protein [Rhodoferax sp.]